MDKHIPSIYAFAAIGVGLLVSYLPPAQNGPAIWGLVGIFFGFAIKHMFAADIAPVEAPVAPAAPVAPPVTPTV